MTDEVLVIPRHITERFHRFSSWAKATELADALNHESIWLPRDLAESDVDWVQVIPCAILLKNGSYCVLRRIRDTREDLRRRLSLVVGGHVDRREEEEEDAINTVVHTLCRELSEELGLEAANVGVPIGVVIDESSLTASRHIAILFEVPVDKDVRSAAREEFTMRSKYSGRALDPTKLARLRLEMDPWSRIIVEDYIGPSTGTPIGAQYSLPLVPADIR